ncbi:MAG: cytochrome c maturation protein CcmE [Bacteroidetes bacterium]|nr:MAG: cytochrome c maturation protein CcmE [Bacteroidota bacterium]
MKKTNIFLIIVIAVLMGVMVVSLNTNSGSYASFKVAAENPNKTYDIVGKLDTTKVIYYNALENSDEFSFYMFDENNENRKVIVNKPKPQDFERSTQVVVTGNMKDNEFRAKNILLKCPSKYEGKASDIKVKKLN